MTTLLAESSTAFHASSSVDAQFAVPATARQRSGAAAWKQLEADLSSWKDDLRRLDRSLLRRSSDATALGHSVEQAFMRLETALNDLLGPQGGLDPVIVAEIGARVQAEALPYLLLSEVAERWYTKPRGYAGDFQSIAAIYANEPRGVGRIGPVVDRCFLNLAAAKAVRNRRALMQREIRMVTDALGGARPARVTSLACGPATELFDTYGELAEVGALETTLIDLDLAALSSVADRRDASGLKRQMRVVHENLLHLATGRRRLDVSEQDLVYSIGLIDYFDDDMVVRLLDFVHGVLRPGGQAILGNFHPRNPTRAMLDLVLEWPLIHRSEEDMHRLFKQSRFASPCTRIAFEEEGINLFAVGEK